MGTIGLSGSALTSETSAMHGSARVPWTSLLLGSLNPYRNHGSGQLILERMEFDIQETTDQLPFGRSSSAMTVINLEWHLQGTAWIDLRRHFA